MGQVVLLHADDGAALAGRVSQLLLGSEPFQVTANVEPLPATWDEAVVLVLLTPGALADAALARRTDQAAQNKLPIVPVVEDLDTYQFGALPASLHMVMERNAEGMESDDRRARLVETVKDLLGMEVSSRAERKVFISYRRTDGSDQAEKIFKELWDHRFFTFMDTHQIPGGAVVQPTIMTSLADKDFVLLLDSPDAAGSPWVVAEVTHALARGVPVCVVCLADDMQMGLLRDQPRVVWDKRESDAENLRRVRLMVARGMAARNSLDRRVEGTLRQAAALHGLDVDKLLGRGFLLRRGRCRALVEFEDAAVSLERLHRLHTGHDRHKPCRSAIYVCGDAVVLPPTRDAVEWARRRVPLKVMPVRELFGEIERVFQPPARTPAEATP